MAFNPFSKILGTRVEADDLHRLIGVVAEGYYVEYKEDFPKPAKIARSIASLANTYGGWYLVGVRTDAAHVASEICGFLNESYPDPVSKVRDAAKNRIDPVPIMYPMAVALNDTHSALVVYVPPDQNTPFITDDGRVYRRNHDSSDPVPEDRRHTLDHLHNKGRDASGMFKALCRVEHEPERLQFGIGWFNLFLQPTPAGIIQDTGLLRQESVDRLLKLSHAPQNLFCGDDWSITGNLPFDHAQLTYTSVRFRQHRFALTDPAPQFELFPNGNARIHIPVELQRLVEFLGQPEYVSTAQDELDKVIAHSPVRGDAVTLRAFDAARVLLSILLVLGHYRDWIGTRDYLPDYKVAFSFQGFESTIPFVDTDEWALLVSRWGLPLLPASARVPEDWDVPILIKTDGPIENLPLQIVHHVAGALGFLEDMTGTSLARALQRAGSQ